MPERSAMGLANKGWIKGTSAGCRLIGWMIKPLGRWSLIMEIDEGFAGRHVASRISVEQLPLSKAVAKGRQSRKIWLGSNSTQEAQFSAIDAITASELINDIEALFE